MKIPMYWAGLDGSFEQVMQANEKVEALMAQPGMTAGYIDDMVARLPKLWRHQGSVAVVEINGPVVQGSAGYMRLFGVLGYDDIAGAAVEAAMHDDTQKMMYKIDSPGGDVAGVVDMGTLLGQLSALKPSAVYTTELMASAGYWMATAIKGTISAGPTAIIGSIGVLRVHQENSKAMEMRGVTATIIRSGEFKAELNSIEPLTESAKGRAEEQMEEVHKLFRKQVGAGRANLTAEQLADVTRGQTFLGQAAVKAGLVDRVQSFDLALKLLDKQKHSSNTPSIPKGNKATMNIVLTAEQLKKLQGGATMASLGLNDDGTVMSAEEITARDAGAASAGIQAELDTTKAELAQVKADLATAQAGSIDIAPIKAELATAKVKIADLEKIAQHHDGLLGLAREATAKMLIPMGGSQAAVDGMDAAAVLAEHTRVQPLFLAKFPVGQRSHAADDDKGSKGTVAKLPLGFALAVKNTPSANR